MHCRCTCVSQLLLFLHINGIKRDITYPASTKQPRINTKVVHTRLPSVGFQSWFRFLAVSLQVTWVINPAVPLLSARPAVTPATFKRGATSFAAWWTEAQWVWTVCLRLLPDSVPTAISTEPGSFCAWVQHANHSATEPHRCHRFQLPRWGRRFGDWLE